MQILGRAGRLWMAMAALAAMLCGGMTTAAIAQPGPRVTGEFLTGHWTDNGDCSSGIEFYADGRFRIDGGGEGRWSLSGDQLSFHGQSSRTARIHASDANTVVLTHPDGSVGRSTRCSAQAQSAATPRRIAMPPVPGTAEEVLRMSVPATAAMLIGQWTDDGNCGSVIDFRRDGRFTVPGGGTGTWTLADGILTFIGDTRVTARARAVGNDRILLIHPNGTLGQSLRCR